MKTPKELRKIIKSTENIDDDAVVYETFMRFKDETTCEYSRALINMSQSSYSDYDMACQALPGLEQFDVELIVRFLDTIYPKLHIRKSKSTKAYIERNVKGLGVKIFLNMLSQSSL